MEPKYVKSIAEMNRENIKFWRRVESSQTRMLRKMSNLNEKVSEEIVEKGIKRS